MKEAKLAEAAAEAAVEAAAEVAVEASITESTEATAEIEVAITEPEVAGGAATATNVALGICSFVEN